MNIGPLDWDAMLGAKRAVWQATQAIRNDAARPRPASPMFKLLTNEPLVPELRKIASTLRRTKTMEALLPWLY